MNTDIADKIINCAIKILNPVYLNANSTTNSQKEEEFFLTELQKYENLNVDEIVLTTLVTAKSRVSNLTISEDDLENIEFITISILDKYITNNWNKFNDEEKIRIRNNLLLISIKECNTVNSTNNGNLYDFLVYSNSAIRKLSYIIGSIIINDNFNSWSLFINNILEKRNIIRNMSNYLDIKINKLTRLVLGITNEIIDSLLLNQNLKLNSKIRVSIIHGIRNEIEPILNLISNDIREIINITVNFNNYNDNNNLISVFKLCFYTLQNLTNIIDSSNLIKLRLDELLINILLNTKELNVDEEVIDLLKHLMLNLKKQKKSYFINLEYCDINRFSIGISRLVRNVVLYPQLMIEDPKYDKYLKQIYLVEIFKDLIELSFNSITKFPKDIVFDNNSNKYDTIMYIWNTCIMLLFHPNMLICDLAISSIIFILKNISNENIYFINNINRLNLDILFVIVFIRSVRIGDPFVNYLSNEWNELNILTYNILTNTLNKLNSEELDVFNHFPSHTFCYSHINSKYSILYDQYNITHKDDNNYSNESVTHASLNYNNSSFNKIFGTLKSRIINLINTLVDFERGIALNSLIDTIFNISTFILSSQMFNKKCEKHTSDSNNNTTNLTNCKKLLLLEVIFFFVETIITRLSFNTNQEYIKNNVTNTELNSNASSYLDLLLNDSGFKQSKKWLVYLHNLIDGILKLNFIDLCDYNLEQKKLSFMYHSIICTEWYRYMCTNSNNSYINIDYYSKTFIFYITCSGNDKECNELRKTSAYLFSKMLLNYPNLFHNRISEILSIIEQCLNNRMLNNEERNILVSVLIAATNATHDYEKISQFSLIASNSSIEFFQEILNGNNSHGESFLDFAFGCLVNDLKNTQSSICHKNFSNLLKIKNSLHLIQSLYTNVNFPSDYSEACSGGFIARNEDNRLYFKHPLERISIAIFEPICFIFTIFNSICVPNFNLVNDASMNYLFVFNSISDQEWVSRSDIKSINDERILKLSRILSYNYMFNNEINTIRRTTSFIRNTLVKIIVHIFTLGTANEITFNENKVDISDNTIISTSGFYFNEKYMTLLVKTLIEPILTTPIHILNYIIRNGISKIFSPNTIPRCIENDNSVIFFLENVFISKFVPNIINKLNIEWNNLMISQAYILSLSLSNDLFNKKQFTKNQDPLTTLLKTHIQFKDLPDDLRDFSLLNTIYISHYNDLSDVSFQILRIIDHFFTASKGKLNINKQCNNNNINDNDNSFSNKVHKIQSRNTIVSGIFYNNEQLLMSCFNLISEFLNYPNSNTLQLAIHIIQKYLQHYNNNLSNQCLGVNKNFHLNIIKDILIELLKHSSKCFPFDPLNISQNEDDSNMSTSTPLTSYLSLCHADLIKNVIQEAVNSIIRSDPDCFDYIIKYKNEISKSNKDSSKNMGFLESGKEGLFNNCQNSIIFTIDIPEYILNKAYKTLEFVVDRNNEYNPLGSESNHVINQQDILLVSRLFIQEYILDKISSDSYFSISIENLLILISQASKMAIQANNSNYKNPYSEFNTYIRVLNFDNKVKQVY